MDKNNHAIAERFFGEALKRDITTKKRTRRGLCLVLALVIETIEGIVQNMRLLPAPE